MFVCCVFLYIVQVAAFATSRSVVERSPTACCVCIIYKPERWSGIGTSLAVAVQEIND